MPDSTPSRQDPSRQDPSRQDPSRQDPSRQDPATQDPSGEASRLLRLLSECTTVRIAYVGKDLRFRYVNRAYERIHGVPAGEICGREVRQVLGEEAFRVVAPHMQDVLAGKSVCFEAQVPLTTGVSRFLHADYIPDRTPSNEIAGFIALITDITELRQTEMALRQSEERHRLLLEHAGVGIAYYDLQGTLLLLNRAGATYLDGDPDSYRGKSAREIFGERIAEQMADRIERAVSGQFHGHYRDKLALPTGERWLHSTYTPIRGEGGDCLGIQIISDDITGLMEAQERIQHNEEFLEQTGLLARVGGWELDMESDLLRMTAAAWSLLEVPPDDSLTFESVLAYFDQEVHPRLRDAVEGARSDLKPFDLEVPLTTGTGRPLWLHLIGRPVIHQGRCTRLSGVAQDITEQRSAARALKEATQRMHLALDAAQEGIWEYEIATGAVTLDPNAMRMLGQAPETLTTTLEWLTERVHPEDREAFDRALTEYLENRTAIFACEYRLRRRSQSYAWIAAHGLVLRRDDHGKPQILVGVHRDVSAQKSSEREIRELKNLYESILQKTQQGFWVTDEHDRIVYVNPAMEKIAGVPGTSVLGCSIVDGFPTKTVAEFLPFYERAGQLREPVYYEASVVTPGGQPTVQSGWIIPQFVAEEFRGMICSVEDVTEQHRREQERSDRHAELVQLFEAIPDAVVYTDAHRNIRLLNSAFTRIFGYPADEVSGRKADMLCALDGEPNQPYRPLCGTGAASDTSVHEFFCRRKDSTTFPAEVVCTPVSEAKGESPGTLIIIRDITDKHVAAAEAEHHRRQIAQADKLASLGVLVAGVAHEINNPNQFIRSNIGLMERAWQTICPILDAYLKESGEFSVAGIDYPIFRSQYPEMLQRTRRGSEKIMAIIRELREFARQQDNIHPQPVPVPAVLNTAVILTENLVHSATKHFQIEIPPDLPDVQGHQQQLEQVVVNLLLNASQSLRSPEDAMGLRAKVDAMTREVHIQVWDHGAGIAPGDLPRVTDPFFTTKRNEGGTGLGLSISSRIVREHGGRLEIDTELGKGTIVTVRLPMVESQPLRPPSEESFA